MSSHYSIVRLRSYFAAVALERTISAATIKHLMKKLIHAIRTLDQSRLFVPVVWLTSLTATIGGLYIASFWQNLKFTSTFSRFDTSFYQSISEGGYLRHLPMDNGRILANKNAFFPTFPMAVRYFDKIFPGGTLAAGLVLNALVTLATFYVFYRFCLTIQEHNQAVLTFLAFAFFPGAFIFFWFYSEAFLAFFIACALYSLATKRIWIASIFIGCATLTRPNGLAFAIMVPLFIVLSALDSDFYKLTIERLKKYGIALVKACVSFLISISGFVAFMLYLGHITGMRDAWFRIEREGWGEGTRPFRQILQYIREIPHAGHPFHNWVIICYIALGFLFLLSIVLYVHKAKYSPIAIAVSIPSMIVIVLALSNNIACGSPRFYAVAPAIFLSLTTHFSPRTMKIIIFLFLVMQISTSAFYTWPYNAA